MNIIRLEVTGRPAPKGSGRAILIAGHARLVPSGSNVNRDNLKSWDQSVRLAAAEVARGAGAPLFVDVAIRVSIAFRLVRPAGHWRKKGGLKPSAPQFPGTKPDLDKLARATGDSLRGTIYDDDSRIVAMELTKTYALPGTEGATIVIRAADTSMPPPL
jgi:Holliday junction resolvase RusA-like endonuclease